MSLLTPLPDDARVWLFASADDMTSAAEASLLDRVRDFVADWRSHGRPVAAAAEVVEGRVLAIGGVISAAELNAGVSGCGIDAMTHAVEAAAAELGIVWMDGPDVAYRGASGWRSVPRTAFRRLAREEAVTPATDVLDLTVTTAGELRSRGIVRPAGEAWHGRVFWPPPVTAE